MSQTSPDRPRILLLWNSPKARRYFQALQAASTEAEVILAPVGLFAAGPRLDAQRRQQLADYSMRRKRARGRIPAWRLRLLECLHQAFAQWHYNAALARIRRCRPQMVGVWAGQAVDVRAAVAAAEDQGLRAVRFECGLLPGTVSCDARGVNFENSLPRNPAFYASYPVSSMPERRLLPRPARRRHAAIDLPERFVFVPFQVRLDSQVLLYSPRWRSMPALFELMTTALEAAPDLHLVFKQHPSCAQSYPDLLERAAAHPRLHFANGNCTQELIESCLGVATLNSTVGIEALIFERPVLVLGQACYAIPGVAEQAVDVGDVRHWLRCLAQGQPPAAPLAPAFLSYLAREYCVPGHFRSPDPAHTQAMQRRLRALAAGSAPADRGGWASASLPSQA